VPRKYSLKYKRDFDYLFKNGIRKKSQNFSIVICDSNEFKVAFIVSKKNIPKANRRIYSKRVAREIFRKEILDNISKYKKFIAITINTDLKEFIKSNSFSIIKSELVELLKQINFDLPTKRR
jgi:ribonuclease P protein component